LKKVYQKYQKEELTLPKNHGEKMKPTGPTNPLTRKLIANLEKKEDEKKGAIWAAVAERLSKATRRKVEVNLSKLERICNEGDTVVIPGKLLASGILTKAVKVAAASASSAAVKKLAGAGGSFTSIEELAEKNPSGKGVRIIS